MRTTLLLIAALLTTAAWADLTLVRGGATRATIIALGETPEVAEAAEALQATLRQMSRTAPGDRDAAGGHRQPDRHRLDPAA
jgi:hypothetical protein